MTLATDEAPRREPGINLRLVFRLHQAELRAEEMEGEIAKKKEVLKDLEKQRDTAVAEVRRLARALYGGNGELPFEDHEDVGPDGGGPRPGGAEAQFQTDSQGRYDVAATLAALLSELLGVDAPTVTILKGFPPADLVAIENWARARKAAIENQDPNVHVDVPDLPARLAFWLDKTGALVDLLALVMDHPPKRSTVEAWTDAERETVWAWASAMHVRASDETFTVPETPKVLRVIADAATHDKQEKGRLRKAAKDAAAKESEKAPDTTGNASTSANGAGDRPHPSEPARYPRRGALPSGDRKRAPRQRGGSSKVGKAKRSRKRKPSR